ncbi:PLP-dependent aminotransferase family protein, partial [Burkholderia pseudomallei]|nr:PLP-dependent aminotransferase family protein [Burkholderia pseudomallei]
ALPARNSRTARAASGLLLGYACVPEDEIGRAFDALSRAIDDVAFGRAAAASAAPASTSAAAASSASSASAASTTSAAARMPRAVAR